MARAPNTAGASIEPAYQHARTIEADLEGRGLRAVELERFEELAAEVLGDEQGSEAVSRLRRYAALHALDAPILLLVGGGAIAAFVIVRKSHLPDTDPADPGLGAS
jgi:2-phosphoglycerate kinase